MGVKDEKVKTAATGGKGNKGAKRKAFYAAQFSITERNKKRRLSRHIKHFPDDINATRIYGERYSR